MANTNRRISGKRNKVASHFKIVQPLTEDSFYTTESVPNSQHSSKSKKIYPKTSEKTRRESNGHMQGQIPLPNYSKQNEEIFGSSYKIQTETQMVNVPSNVYETNKSKHFHGSTANQPSCRFRRTHFQNSNIIPNITQGTNTDIFIPTRNEIVYNMTNPQITPFTGDKLTHRNKRNSFTAEIHHQTGDNVPERNHISFRENERPLRDQQDLFYNNSHDRSTHPNDPRQVNPNIIVPTRDEILYLNNGNPTVQTSSVNNGLIEYRRNSAAAYANYLANQGRNNTIINAYCPSRGSPVKGNNIGQHIPCRQALNTLDQTPPLTNDGHQINHNSQRNKNNMSSDPNACNTNTSIDYVYSNKGESEVYASTVSPRTIQPTFVKYQNSPAHLAHLSTQPISSFPPFIVPQTDVFYSESEKKDKHCSSAFETEKKDATNVESLRELYILNAQVAPPVIEGSTGAVGELQYKTKNARVKCSCGKKMRFMVSVLDNDQRNCEKCYSRVKGEFKDMFESYKKQGYHQCSCKGDLSITDVTNNYLKDQKLECTCDDGFNAVHTCGQKPSSRCNKSTTAKSQCSKSSRPHHRRKAPCKEVTSEAITVFPVTEKGSLKLPDHLHKSSLRSSDKEKKNGLGYRITEVYSFTKTSSSNLLSSLQKTISDTSKNILSSLEKVETYLATATGISNKTDVVPKSSSVSLPKESASQLQKYETSKEHIVPQRSKSKSKFLVLKDTGSNKPQDCPKSSSESSAKEKTSLLAKHESVDEQTGTTDSSSNKPQDYPKSSSVSSDKETARVPKYETVEEQTGTKDTSSKKLNDLPKSSSGSSAEEMTRLAKYETVEEQTRTKDTSSKKYDLPKSSSASSAEEKTSQLAKYKTMDEQTVSKSSRLNKSINCLKSSFAKENTSQEGSYQTVEALTPTETTKSDRHHARHKRSSHSSAKKKKKALAAIDSSHRNTLRQSSSGASCIRPKQHKPKKRNKSFKRSLSRTSSSHYKLTIPGKGRLVNRSDESICTGPSVTILPNVIHHPSTASADKGIKPKGILHNRSQSQSLSKSSSADLLQRKRSTYSRTRFE